VTQANLVVFLQGISAMGALAVGLFFLRFWKDSGDRLFGFFAVAFWMLAGSWSLLAILSPTEEARPYVYALRLLAFFLIIVATIDKNRLRR
jgi:hypothetical protein